MAQVTGTGSIFTIIIQQPRHHLTDIDLCKAKGVHLNADQVFNERVYLGCDTAHW